jgi:hypothetical protein
MNRKGIVPNHLKKQMLSHVEKNKIDMRARDHLHNEFLDISVNSEYPHRFNYC